GIASFGKGRPQGRPFFFCGGARRAPHPAPRATLSRRRERGRTGARVGVFAANFSGGGTGAGSTTRFHAGGRPLHRLRRSPSPALRERSADCDDVGDLILQLEALGQAEVDVVAVVVEEADVRELAGI